MVRLLVCPSPEIKDILLPHSLVSGVSYIAVVQNQKGQDFEEIKEETSSIQTTERFLKGKEL